MTNPEAHWVTASASSGSGNCVQMSHGPAGTVLVRDSKNPTGPELMFTHAEIAAFLDGARGGEFDQFG